MSGRGLLVTGASEIASLAGGLRRGASQGDVSALVDTGPGSPGTDAGGLAVAAFEGRIVALGRHTEVTAVLDAMGLDEAAFEVVRAGGGTVTPGLIDPHTHLLFAGTREAELALRQRGAGYLDILAAGGGILSTVAATRRATRATLVAHGRRWIAEMLAHGVTTVEAKSGYGLDADSELRLLEVAAELSREGPVEVVPTFLGAHAVPAEYRERADGTERYVTAIIEEQLPAVERQGVAVFCDVFCEPGVFSVEQSRRILDAARAHRLVPRLHADELHPSGGAQLAAEIRAASADHLGAVTDAGIEALSQAADAGEPVVATLLPATTLHLRAPHAPARGLIDRGVPVALATDFNPGTSPTPNLQVVVSLACIVLGMTASEALAAVTVNAAAALGLDRTHGSLESGKQADLVIWDVSSHRLIPYWVGADLVSTVVKRGRVVHRRGEAVRSEVRIET